MKKKFTVIFVILAVICTAVFFTACTKTESGMSAYELAVKNGFEGTEQEWLEYLKGEDGKDGTNGQDGKDGANGTNGMDGKDASITALDLYNEAVAQGYEGTYFDFIKEYFDVNVSTDYSAVIAKNLSQSVSVVCAFEVTKNVTQYVPGQGLVSVPTTETAYSGGSGVFYGINKETGSAYIITNYHVVYNQESNDEDHISDDINVYLYGGEISGQGIKATYVGGSMNYDIALLYVENNDAIKSEDISAVTFADSNTVSVGETAIAIGNAEGDGISATVGVINVDSEEIELTSADEKSTIVFRVMRIDTAVNSGNSGGGLFNKDGRLIGIVNAKIISSNVEGIGYALPSTLVKYVVENILDHQTEGGVVKKCLLGVTVQTVGSKAIYDKDNGKVSIEETVKVIEVGETALAYGKVQIDDIIKGVKIDRNGDGTVDETYNLTRSFILVDLMLTMREGDKLTLVVSRMVEEVATEVEITLTMTEECITVYK